MYGTLVMLIPWIDFSMAHPPTPPPPPPPPPSPFPGPAGALKEEEEEEEVGNSSGGEAE